MLVFLMWTGCGIFDVEPVDSSPDSDPQGQDSGPVDTSVEAAEHCGEIHEDTQWLAADSPHHVTCDIEVLEGTLTIEAGSTVRFDAKAGIRVANGDFSAGLVVAGTADAPVRLLASGEVSEPTWQGLDFGPLTQVASVSHAEIQDSGRGLNGAILAEDVSVLLDHVSIAGSEEAGLFLKGTAALEEGSTAVTITGSGTVPVSVGASAAHSLPSADSSYDGNTTDAVVVRGETIEVPVEWADLGVPYRIEGSINLAGTAEQEAVLTIGPGANLVFDQGDGLTFSKGGAASSLFVNGTAEAPVSFEPLGAEEQGYWDGLAFNEGVVEAEIHHARIAWGGGGSGAGGLDIEDVEVLLDHVEIVGAEGAGLAFRGSGQLAAGSTAVTVSQSETAISTTANAYGTLPTEDSSYTGNDRDVLVVEKDGEVSVSATWSDLGLPVEVDVTVEVDGTATEPTILTIAAGLELRFGNDRGLFVSKNGGAAGLVAVGTEEAPIVFGPRDANTPGAWSGIGVWPDAEPDQVTLERLVVSSGGGKTLDGNIHIDSVAGTVTDVEVNDSEQYGLYLEGEAELYPTVSGLTGEGNTDGLQGWSD